MKLLSAGYLSVLLTVSLLALLPRPVKGGGGPIGIDHRLSQSDTGIWSRSNQNALQYLGVTGNMGVALWEGGDTHLGKTAWQSLDSMALSAVVANAAKPVFGRQRPSQTDDPNQWFKGGRSFPSGEVATITGIVTPYILEYRYDYPTVWALELLPAYDAVARMKSRGHWQTDVLAGFAVGTGSGYLAHSRENPLILGLLPSGFTVGFRKQF